MPCRVRLEPRDQFARVLRRQRPIGLGLGISREGGGVVAASRYAAASVRGCLLVGDLIELRPRGRRNKRPCEVRTSNAGHCLLTGIAGPERAWLTAQTLMREDLFTGWGVRTLGSSEVRFNPMSYHNGSVWPHDNALVAWGMARYGFKEPVHKILTGLFDSASLFVDLHRLPELFSGSSAARGKGHAVSVACAPQAWRPVLCFSFAAGVPRPVDPRRGRTHPFLRPDFAGIFAGSADRKSSRRSCDGGPAASTPSTGREHSRTAHGRSNRDRKTGSGPNANPLRPLKDLEEAVRMTRQWRGWALILIGTMASFVGLLGDPVQANERTREQLRRAKVFLEGGRRLSASSGGVFARGVRFTVRRKLCVYYLRLSGA